MPLSDAEPPGATRDNKATCDPLGEGAHAFTDVCWLGRARRGAPWREGPRAA
jgi:hypothetical protein